MPDPTDSRLARLRTIARALDSAVPVPGTNFRFGLDPVLGLLPGVGDLAGSAMSAYIVYTGMQLGVPRAAVVRMIGNVAIDTLVGSMPVLGDLFDAGWKSNTRNLALIESHVGSAAPPPPVNRWFVFAVVAVLVLLVAGGIALTVAVVRLLLGLF